MNLPDDPEEAFAALHLRKYKELEKAWEENSSGSWYHERRYVDCLIAFDDVYGLGVLADFRTPPRGEREFGEFFQDFRRYVEISSQKFLMEAARRAKREAGSIVVLDDVARTALHHLISKIRDKLNEINLPEDKRESLFNKLNAFAAEVDRNRTRTQGYYAFAVEFAKAARQVNVELRPLQDTVDKILDWLDRATSLKDALPPWSERKGIEGPRKRITDRTKDADIDDDIPF